MFRDYVEDKQLQIVGKVFGGDRGNLRTFHEIGKRIPIAEVEFVDQTIKYSANQFDPEQKPIKGLDFL
jgi:hypothetical protein